MLSFRQNPSQESIMKRFSFAARAALVTIVLVQSFLLAIGQRQNQATPAHPRRIAVFGSSVAFGTGDETNKEGYTGLLREKLAPRGWEVLNQSRGGDTTKALATRWAPEGTPNPGVRYLMTVNPGYVVIALSLANEGILEASTREAKEAVFNQYAEGIRGFIERARQNNIVPIIGLVYPRMSYTPVEYEYARRMNLLQNSWDAPSVNFMGALDDGTGRYTIGFDSDDRHPNAAGHHELSYAIVPSLFEAMETGKLKPSRPEGTPGFTRVTGGSAPFTFEPTDTVHSFAMSFVVRVQGDGTVASLSGSPLAASTETKRGGRGAAYESMTLTPSGEFKASIGVQNGKWIYRAANGSVASAQGTAGSDWHHVLLSHYTARGETLFFVDGQLVGKVAERLEPRRFVLGGPGSGTNPAAPKQSDYKDLFIYRAALNADEVAAIASGKILQASLEIYAPLADARFAPAAAVENRAQSLSALKVGDGRVTHVDK
jgi:lysophospholipase L1-like esterase